MEPERRQAAIFSFDDGIDVLERVMEVIQHLLVVGVVKILHKHKHIKLQIKEPEVENF